MARARIAGVRAFACWLGVAAATLVCLGALTQPQQAAGDVDAPIDMKSWREQGFPALEAWEKGFAEQAGEILHVSVEQGVPSRWSLRMGISSDGVVRAVEVGSRSGPVGDLQEMPEVTSTGLLAPAATQKFFRWLVSLHAYPGKGRQTVVPGWHSEFVDVHVTFEDGSVARIADFALDSAEVGFETWALAAALDGLREHVVWEGRR
ncbi:MAG: hypothetical protein H6825_14815 [Planctomycetes bacterium]|nr:hypothetical protein [Planctomycetota bacterium]